MTEDPEATRDASRSLPLVALGAALQRFDPSRQPLGALLAGHADAARLLTDALLDGAGVAEPGGAERAEAPIGDAATADNPTIGSYRLLREIGRGGQAVVFEAIDLRLGRRVALKVLRVDVFRSQATESRFRAEAMTTSRLDHPCICSIYEIGTDDDQLFLAMRFVEGATLAQHITTARQVVLPGRPYQLLLEGPAGSEPPDQSARRLRPWLSTLRLMEVAARALHAAHLAGVTHRDFKPGNLMVQRDGNAVVLDFGMAGDDQRDGATLTQSGDVFGTPAYMAPEQCRDSKLADARSDVFALGATLFEALTGEVAFDGPTPQAVIRRILSGRVPDPRRFVPGLPRELAVIVGKALDPDPDRRYQTAAAFAEDLLRFCQARPILAEPPSLWLVSRRWVQRNPWLTALVLVTAIGIAISSLTLWQAHVRRQEVDHLTLAQSLRDLRSAYPALLPIQDHAAEARAWCTSARRLLRRMTDIEARVDAMGRDALPPDAQTLARMRSSHPATRELDELAAIDASLSAGLGTAEALAAQRAAAADRNAREAELRAELEALRPWEFADPERQRIHDSMTTLLAELSEFQATDGQLATVERELAALTSAGSTSWQQAIESIATLPIYGGLHLRQQTGLQPLRYNEQSHLWEFVHLRSGTPPRIGANGRLAVAADSGIVFVLLPGGAIPVGNQDQDPASPHYLAKPRPIDRFLLTVPLEPFFFAAHEITQAQWLRLGGRNQSIHAAGSTDGRHVITLVHPVENVSWSDAFDLLTRTKLTLPTDLQFEYVARACPSRDSGRPEADAWLDYENLFDQAAVAVKLNGFPPPRPQNDGWAFHAPVGSFRPNALGIHDVLGNVLEWCLDPETYPDRDLVQTGTGLWLAPDSPKHMVRGGSFLSSPNGGDLPSQRAASLDIGMWAGVRAARAIER